MLDKLNRLNPQPKNIPELKTALLMIWDELPQEVSENQSLASTSGNLAAARLHQRNSRTL